MKRGERMFWNGILIAAIGVGTLVGLGLRLRSKGSKAASAGKPQDWTWEKLDAAVKQYFITWTSDILMDVYANEEEFRRETARRLALKKALKACNNGEPAAKEYIKEWIVDIVEQHIKLAADELERLISFNSPALLTVQDKFDLLLYAYKQRYGYEALDELIRTYKWAELKVTPSAEDESGYVVMSGDVDAAFRLECLQFAHRDRIRIVAQRLYQRYKGFSVIDEMRDMRIDGVSGGINGVPEVLAGTPYSALVQPESGTKRRSEPAIAYGFFIKEIDSFRVSFLRQRCRAAKSVPQHLQISIARPVDRSGRLPGQSYEGWLAGCRSSPALCRIMVLLYPQIRYEPGHAFAANYG